MMRRRRKAYGANEVVILVRMNSERAVLSLMKRFGMRSIQTGALVVHGMSEPLRLSTARGQWNWAVQIHCTNTCHNQASAQSDANRFVRSAVKGEGPLLWRRYSVDVQRESPWRPLPCPDPDCDCTSSDLPGSARRLAEVRT